MLRNTLFKKRSVVFNWLFSYIIFLIIFLVVSFLIYFNTTAIIETEVNNANKVLLNSAQNDMDKILLEARKVSLEAFFNVRVQRLLYLEKDISDSDYYDVSKVLQDLKVYNTSSKSINDIYIMLKGINKVVSFVGITDINTFYSYNYGFDTTVYESWLKEYDDNKVDKYSLIFADKKGVVINKILYIRALSPVDNKDLTTSITVTINIDSLIDQLATIAKINKGVSFILADNIVVAATKPVKLPDNFKIITDGKDNNPIYTTINGEKVVFSYISSKVNNWKYVTIIPKEVFLSKIQRIRNITYLGVLCSTLLGGFLIYYFLRKNYNPINKLLGILSHQSNFTNTDKDKNEYAIIEKGLQKAIDDKKTISEQLSNQKQRLMYNFIERLLKGSAQEEIPINEALQSYNISFHSNYFTVILIYLSDLITNSNNGKNLNDIYFIFTNIVEELVGIHHKGLMVEVDGTMACLVNINEDRLSDVKTDLQKAVEDAESFILKYFHIHFTASISCTHIGIEQIPFAYKESLDAMNYKKVLGIKQTLCFEDIHDNYQGTYYYPLNKEQQLINLIKCGDYTGAKLTIEEIFDINFVKNHLAVDLAQCLMLNMVSTMIRVVNEVSSHSKDNFLEDLNPISRLLPCKSVEEMKQQLDIFLQAFCKHMNQINNYSSNWVITDVVPYILKNYSDINLSVAVLAEKFDVHPVYISKVFKEEVSDGLLDFINKTRSDRSKLLLRERKDCNLEEISKEVGFNNVRTFSRVFKKYEGVTPGKFKDMI